MKHNIGDRVRSKRTFWFAPEIHKDLEGTLIHIRYYTNSEKIDYLSVQFDGLDRLVSCYPSALQFKVSK